MSRMPSLALTLGGRTDRWSGRERLLVAIVCAFNFAIRIYRFDFPIVNGWQFRYTQTAWGIRSLMRDGFNPLTMETPVLGPPWRIPFEFPTFQLLAASIGRVGSLDPAYAGRLTASVVFAVGITAVYALARQLAGISVAWVAVLIYGFSAFGLNWGSQVLIDFTATTLGVAFLALVLREGRASSWSRTIAICCLGTIATLSKSTTGLAWVIVGGTVVSWWRPTWRARVRLWLPSVLAPTIVTLAWTRLTDRVKDSNPHTEFLLSGRLNFGGHHFRRPADLIEMAPWRILVEHALQPSIGSVLLGVVLVLAAWTSTAGRRTALLLTGVLCSAPLIFNGLYLTHDYYFIAVYPAFVILCATGLVTIGAAIQRSSSSRGTPGLTVAAAMAVCIMSWTSPEGVENMNMLLTRQRAGVMEYPEISDNVGPDQHLIVIGQDWDPTLLYVVDRKGLMLRPNGSRPEEGELGTFYEFVYWAEPDPTAEQWAEYFPPELRYEPISANFYRIFPLTN